jgi:hypothetical protein
VINAPTTTDLPAPHLAASSAIRKWWNCYCPVNNPEESHTAYDCKP